MAEIHFLPSSLRSARLENNLILEDPAGRCVGIEIKASATLAPSAFTGLRLLASELGPKFVRGIVLYTGTESVSFGTNLWAMPMEAVWRTPRTIGSG